MRFGGAGETRREVVEISRDHRLLRWSKHAISNQEHHNEGDFFFLGIFV